VLLPQKNRSHLQFDYGLPQNMTPLDKPKLPPDTLSFFWSRRAVCHRIGHGAAMLGIASLLFNIATLGSSKDGGVVFIIFGPLALLFAGLGAWLLFPALEKLTQSSTPAIWLSPSGLHIASSRHPYAWTDLLKAEVVKTNTDQGTRVELTIHFKKDGRTTMLDLSMLRGEVEELTQAINEAIYGKRPWKRASSYKPNVVERSHRILYVLFSVVLMLYAAWGIWLDDVYLPAKRGGAHFQGAAALAMGLALICGAITFVIEVVDHYDRRNNEHWYDRYSCITIISGWSLAIVAVFVK
jgi:hypothetical protein